MIERFDRVQSGDRMRKVHYVSWSDMSHAHRDTVGTFSYEQFVLTARELEIPQIDIDQIYRIAVFNVIERNQDDYTKNFGFIMDREGEWRRAWHLI